jgi:hypothetical protein
LGDERRWRSVIESVSRVAKIGALLALPCCVGGGKRAPARTETARSAVSAISTPAVPSSVEAEQAVEPAPKLYVARKVAVPASGSGHAQPPRATDVVLGERWGCAVFGTDVGSRAQCWRAPSNGTGKPLRAFEVPWLANRSLMAAPDRVCEFATPALTFRCWHAPRANQPDGIEVAASQEWQNPNKANWNDAYARADRVHRVVLGGTFACLQASRDESVWCLGDDSLGQLGGSQPVPPPQAARTDPAFVQKIWPARSLALGTWHACALAAPSGLAQGGYIACWGRADRGQLGTPAPDECVAGDTKIACARSPVAGVQVPSPVLALYAGDLYTCASTPEGTRCWGANRDGFFGSGAACPPELKQAWPTLHGAVAAPRAACSSQPVMVRGIAGFQQSMSVGPRGVCFAEHAPLECLGAVRTPRAKDIRNVVVSPGEDASACGLRDAGVACWGEGYSKPGTPEVPVAIEFAPLPVIREIAVVGGDDESGYAPSCLIRRGCNHGPAPLATCAPGTSPMTWAELYRNANAQVGQQVTVRGPLGVGNLFNTLAGCRSNPLKECCNRAGGPVVMGGAPLLALDGFFCSGDESRACCNAPAYGQTVVAAGRLERDENAIARHASGFRLRDAKLCVER